jgi:ABC-type nitrate/sulfonate/bicarbonate transport system permease component
VSTRRSAVSEASGTLVTLRHAALRVGRTIGLMALSIGVTLALWQGILSVTHLNPYFAKGPVAVYDFLFEGPEASFARSTVLSAFWTTLRDAGLGYVAGTAAALLVAVLVVLRRAAEQTIMPVAIALRSVPLVAMTPVLTLLFGRNLVTVTIISGIVTFFPTLVNVAYGLRATPALALDMATAYGASEKTALLKVQLPYALPALFSSARIAAPGALLGAVIAEWLATGKGLGELMISSSSTSQYGLLWASVVVITTTSVLIYNLVSALEGPVVLRYGATA